MHVLLGGCGSLAYVLLWSQSPCAPSAGGARTVPSSRWGLVCKALDPGRLPVLLQGRQLPKAERLAVRAQGASFLSIAPHGPFCFYSLSLAPRWLQLNLCFVPRVLLFPNAPKILQLCFLFSHVFLNQGDAGKISKQHIIYILPFSVCSAPTQLECCVLFLCR